MHGSLLNIFHSSLFILHSAFEMVGDPGLAPGRLGDFKSPGSAIPAEASRREMACQPEPGCGGQARLRPLGFGAQPSTSLRSAKAGGHEGNCTPKAARF